MNIRLFNRKYWLRRFGVQKVVKGYLTSGHKDVVVSIHVHPAGTDTISALPEGERRTKRLEGHGEVDITPANQDTGCKGDLLYYYGDWYECVSSQPWRTTMLSHYNYQFVLVPRDASGVIDMEAPAGDPDEQGGG